MWYPSANRDEEIFERPQAFDVGRRFNEHLAFGTGEHYCLGASLARLEAQVALETLTERLQSYKVVDPEGLRYVPSYVLRGLERVDLDIELVA